MVSSPEKYARSLPWKHRARAEINLIMLAETRRFELLKGLTPYLVSRLVKIAGG
jgi:hypothetical protein